MSSDAASEASASDGVAAASGGWGSISSGGSGAASVPESSVPESSVPEADSPESNSPVYRAPGSGGPVADPSPFEAEPAGAAEVFGDGIGLVREYAGWLAGAGVVRGLIGPREGARIWTRHVLNCGVVASLLPPEATVVDVGSGAGLPGIPLAIARPDCSITLVEPLERRVVFLDEVVAALGLSNVRVVRGRAEDVVDECGGADVVTSRAVAPLAKLARWCVPLARDGGEVLAMKGSSAAAEIERDRAAAGRSGLVDLSVTTVGEQYLDPPTIVLRGVVRAPVKKKGRRR